ncbi:MAG: 30S ribosome-binding factor RbfA [Candidatus Paceibacterota bacterium]
MSDRLKKVNELLQFEVSKILKSEVETGTDVLITVVRAEASLTLEHATIMISVFPSEKEKETLEKIQKEIYSIQQALNKRLVMRTVPKLRFEIDKTEEQASRIEEIIDRIKE